MKTENEIKDDICQFILESPLGSAVSGEVTTRKRPKGSRKEDITIAVLASDAEQVQEAVVNVNIYVPMKLKGGQYEEDEPRETELSRIAMDCLKVGGIGKDYRFTLESQRTFETEATHERCINNKLKYNYNNED